MVYIIINFSLYLENLLLCLMASLNFRFNNSMPKFAFLLIHRWCSKWEIHSVKMV